MVVLVKTLQVILALSVLILIHEFGHFFFAKLFRIRVDKFFLFFDFGGVKLFSTRSPYRPNPIGLSSVRLLDIGTSSTGVPVLHVEGADLIDGTPIIDIKPYLEYADSHQGVRSGFVDTHPWPRLDVRFSPQAMSLLTAGDMQLLRSLLEQDPRPHYHSDEMRIYGMPFDGRDVKFRVENNVLTVVDVV